MNSESLRHEIISKIPAIPEESLKSIKDYIDFVTGKEKKRKARPAVEEKNKARKRKNSIGKLIGLAEVDPFANKIDEILYGKNL